MFVPERKEPAAMTLRRCYPIALITALTVVATACGGTPKIVIETAATTAKPSVTTSAKSSATTVAAKASGGKITADDRKVLVKAILTGGVSQEIADCIADGLEGKVSRDEYLLMAKAKSDAKLPDNLNSIAEEVAIDCASKAAGVTPSSIGAGATPIATTAGPTTTLVKQTIGTKSSPVPLGTKVTLPKQYDFVVNAYTPGADQLVKAANEYNDAAPAGSQYVLVTFTVTNNGIEDKRTPAYDLFPKAVSASGKSYEASSCLATLSNPIPYFNDVFTGTTVSGDVCFIVAGGDAAGLTMYFDIIDESFDKTTYYFKLS
jgi:hypothetical protein